MTEKGYDFYLYCGLFSLVLGVGKLVDPEAYPLMIAVAPLWVLPLWRFLYKLIFLS